MTRQNLSIGLALFMTLFLAACSDQEDVNVGDQNAKEAKARAVKVIEAQKQSFAPIVETLGSLKAKSETTLASEASGTISHIYVKEGDYVKNGDLLLQFDPNNNLTTVSLENARQAFNNSDSLYNLTLSSAESAKKTAELSVEQAVISLETAKKSDSSTDISVEEQIDSVETGIENARVDLELAEKALKDEKENMAKAEKNFMQNAKNTFSSSRVIFLSDLQKADEILGVTDQNSNINN
ncbi:MAG: biotin/lipoyl-binding protein, partial [Candidatus Gracilibacteria bacterium]|nr:biotin/lipoyl-binding protein [Candidatus Gracilibacteria bacterium]